MRRSDPSAPALSRSAPLVLTALLDDVAQQRFDQLRRTHFPAERNHLDAHLTLFHALPGDRERQLTAAVRAAADRRVITARVARVRKLGRGVAYTLSAPELSELRAGLARQWTQWLTAQDRGKADLHVTVQNKVDPNTAAQLHARLAVDFVPYEVDVTGLALWRYLGGPWAPIARFPFA